jgi:Zn-dependent protease with chaperone function
LAKMIRKTMMLLFVLILFVLPTWFGFAILAIWFGRRWCILLSWLFLFHDTLWSWFQEGSCWKLVVLSISVAIVHCPSGCSTVCWQDCIWEGGWVVHTKFPMVLSEP